MNPVTLWCEEETLPSASHLARLEGYFDGNHTDDLTQWLIPHREFRRLSLEDFETIFKATASGHLSWVLLFPDGYRL